MPRFWRREQRTKLKLCRVDRTESEEPDKAGSPSFFPSQFLLVTLPPAPTCCSSLQLLCFWSAVLSSFPYKTGGGEGGRECVRKAGESLRPCHCYPKSIWKTHLLHLEEGKFLWMLPTVVKLWPVGFINN